MNTDGLSFMKKIKSNSIDLILTDPPYGITKKKEKKRRGVISSLWRRHINKLRDYQEWDRLFTMETNKRRRFK